MADAPARPDARPTWAQLRRALGPGIVSGAADDDPSGITTYSLAGAQFGTAFLWTAPVAWPLLAAVQYASARVGMAAGRGFTRALRHVVPRPVLIVVAVALFLANTLNIAADLAGMGDALALLGLGPARLWIVVLATTIGALTARLHYATLARGLGLLALSLLAWPACALLVAPDWATVARATLVPRLPHDPGEWLVLLAILGTTISPYLLVWQASQEVEEERASGRVTVLARMGTTRLERRLRLADVLAGTAASTAGMFFIMLVTASTLHPAGTTHPADSRAVAEALAPVAGRHAMLLYTLGLLGTGLLAIPTLAASAAFALAEVFGWQEGMDLRPRQARAFYAVLFAALAAAVAIDLVGVPPVRALFWSAVVNGGLCPVLLVLLLRILGDRRRMAGEPAGPVLRLLVGLTALLMTGAAVAALAG